MLKIRDVKKNFGDLQVLKGVDLNVDKGDGVAILGPSGSGKTTFLRCINFLETADSGTMVFDGETYNMSRVSKKEIGRIRSKTALENVTEGLIVARKIPKAQAIDKGRKALGKVGLSDRSDYYPHQLSGGQQQRVAIARAIAADPEILFFDEPTSALDPELIGEVLEVMRNLAQEGMTMLVVTHEMNFAKNVSTKVIFMENGQVAEAGNSREFFENPRGERTREFLRLVNV